MKKITALVVVLLSILGSQVVAAQSKVHFLTFKEVQAQVNELPKFYTKYEMSKAVLQVKYDNIIKTHLDPDSELFKQSFSDLVIAYQSAKKTLDTYTELWVTFYLINENDKVLLADGWTQKEIDSAVGLTKKFTEVRDRIRKIDAKNVSVNVVENFILKYNLDLLPVVG